MRVLLVEDSERLRRAIGRALRKEGYAVDACGDGEEGLWFARSHDFDALILDIMLPKLDGIAIVDNLRKEGRKTPILLLTARDSVEDRVLGLRRGADDYLVKPFALPELLARVQALCRRQYGAGTDSLEIGNLRIDMSARLAACGGEPLELTSREFMLLEYLALRQSHIVTRSEIEAHIYGDSVELMSNAVDSAVCALRKKLSLIEGSPVIQTRRGVGYVLSGR